VAVPDCGECASHHSHKEETKWCAATGSASSSLARADVYLPLGQDSGEPETTGSESVRLFQR
jgi:hypothetical protein